MHDIYGGDSRVIGCRRLGARRQSGQVLPVMLFGCFVTLAVLMMAFNSSLLTFRKADLLNAADAAAYSGGVQAARSLNFMAYTNRAMVANTIAAGYAVSYISYMRYLGDFINKISTPRQFLVKVLANTLKSAGDSFAEAAEDLSQNPLNAEPGDGAYDGIYAQGNPDQTGYHAIGSAISEFGKDKKKGLGSAIKLAASAVGFSTVGPTDLLNAFYAGSQIATYANASAAIDDTIQQVAQSYNENIQVENTTSSNFYKWIIPMRPGLDRPPGVNQLSNKLGRKYDQYLSQSVSVSPFGPFSKLPGIKQIAKGLGKLVKPFTNLFGWTEEQIDATTKDFDLGLMKQFIYNSVTKHDAWWIFFNRGWRLCLPTVVCMPPIWQMQFALDKTGVTELYMAARPDRKSPFDSPGGAGSDHGSNHGSDHGNDSDCDSFHTCDEGSDHGNDSDCGSFHTCDEGGGHGGSGSDTDSWHTCDEGRCESGLGGQRPWDQDFRYAAYQIPPATGDRSGLNGRNIDMARKTGIWIAQIRSYRPSLEHPVNLSVLEGSRESKIEIGSEKGREYAAKGYISRSSRESLSDKDSGAQRPWDQGSRHVVYRTPHATADRSGLMSRNAGRIRNTGIWISHAGPYQPALERSMRSAVYRPASSARTPWVLAADSLPHYTGDGESLPNFIMNRFHAQSGGTIAEQANRRMAQRMTVIQRSFGDSYRARMRSMKAKAAAAKAATGAAARGAASKLKKGLKRVGHGSMKFDKLLGKYLYPRNASMFYGANWVAGDVLSNGLFDNEAIILARFLESAATLGLVDGVKKLRYHLYSLAQGEASAKEFWKPYQGVPMYFMLAEVPFTNIHAPMKIDVTLKLLPSQEGLISKLGFDGSQSRPMQASATAKLFYYRQPDDDQNKYFMPVQSGLHPLSVYLSERPVLNRLGNWYGRDAVMTAFWGGQGSTDAVAPSMEAAPGDYSEFDNIFNPFWEVRLVGQ